MAVRVPGARDIGEFWTNLRDGRESIRFFDRAELVANGVPVEVLDLPEFVPAKGVLDDADRFDGAFFGLSPREAEVTDPQQRVFLECAWSALEHAGCGPGSTAAAERCIGVFGGVSFNSYLAANLWRGRRGLDTAKELQLLLHNDKDFLTTLVAYKLDLRGPSVTVQTACSTSLVAVALACDSLVAGRCDTALAGGAAVRVPLVGGYVYQRDGILATDGHCRPFDARATGTVAGDGVGIVVLRRLADAIEEGDPVHAVIRGWCVNNDGAHKVGYTAPSVSQQAKVIAGAQAMAGIVPDSVTFVEAHGSGTTLGDAVEMAALTEAFGSTSRRAFCAVGALKANVGHLDAAAGVVGLVKTVLALSHRQIPPAVNFAKPNPEIDLTTGPFRVSPELVEWDPGAGTRLAGVSSFGMGGTNAHVVLEEAPEMAQRQGVDGDGVTAHLLTLSAKTGAALDAVAAELGDYVESHPESDIADVAYTLCRARQPFGHRRIVVCSDRLDVRAELERARRDPASNASGPPGRGDPVFLLPGQGAQYPNMGYAPYQEHSVFRAAIDRCTELMAPVLGFDLRERLFGSGQLRETVEVQPALFAVEYALARLWQSWGVTPVAMIGHSLGEFVAACLGGVMTVEDAAVVVARRAMLIQGLPPGAMLAVRAAPDIAARLAGAGVEVAAVNSPRQCVLSGTTSAVEKIESDLSKQGVPYRRLRSVRAFHSEMMRPVVDELSESIARIELRPPTVPFVSNATGEWIKDAEATDPQYWAEHVACTVQFDSGLRRIVALGAPALLEVGPGQTLGPMVRELGVESGTRVCASLPSAHDDRAASVVLLRALGELWLAGCSIDGGASLVPAARRLPLPTYPFERQRHWAVALGTASGSAPCADPDDGVPRKLANPLDWFYVPSWRRVPPVAPEPITSDTRWLVLGHPEGIGGRLVERLRRAGGTAWLVSFGAAFERRDDGHYELHPSRPADFRALLEAIDSDGCPPTNVLHAWCAERDFPSTDAELGFASLLLLIQAMGEVGPGSPWRIVALTCCVHDVTGSEDLQPAAATLLGPVHVVPLEYPDAVCRAVDLDSFDVEADRVLAELSPAAHEQVVALRGPHRWVRGFEKLTVPALASDELRHRGTYLIAGGLGGVGRAIAHFLAKTVQARIALVSRDPAAHGVSLPDGGDGLSELRDAGADVLVVAADLTDREQLDAAVATVYERFGPIHGVVHAAGLGEPSMTQVKQLASCERVLAPKVAGTQTLVAVLPAAEELDFFVICSSLAGVLGGIAAVDYCAANAFQDALAARLRRDGIPAVAIDWDTWSGVGMATGDEVSSDLRGVWREATAHGMTTAEGVGAFHRALACRVSQLLVSTRDLDRVMGHRHQVAGMGSVDDLQQQRFAERQRQGARREIRPPRSATEKTIAAMWQELLGLDQVDIQDSFFDLGGHSLLAVQFLNQLHRLYPVEIPLKRLFELPTVAELAARVDAAIWLAEGRGPDGRADGEPDERDEFEI